MSKVKDVRSNQDWIAMLQSEEVRQANPPARQVLPDDERRRFAAAAKQYSRRNFKAYGS